jgi:CheY-specific phosphatase CheX
MATTTEKNYAPVAIDPRTLDDRLGRLMEAAADATVDVFDVTLAVEVRRLETVAHTRPPAREGNLYGWMQLTGETPGVVVVSLGSDLARDLSARLVGVDPGDLSEADVMDGVGEIINQVSGRTATLLAQQGHRLAIGLPSFESEHGEHLDINQEHPSYVMVFECLGRRMSVQVQLEN